MSDRTGVDDSRSGRGDSGSGVSSAARLLAEEPAIVGSLEKPAARVLGAAIRERGRPACVRVCVSVSAGAFPLGLGRALVDPPLGAAGADSLGSPREEAVRAPAAALVVGGVSLAVRAGTDEVDGTPAVTVLATADILPAACLVTPFAFTPGAGMLCLMPAAEGPLVGGGTRGFLGKKDSLGRAEACSCFGCGAPVCGDARCAVLLAAKVSSAALEAAMCRPSGALGFTSVDGRPGRCDVAGGGSRLLRVCRLTPLAGFDTDLPGREARDATAMVVSDAGAEEACTAEATGGLGAGLETGAGQANVVSAAASVAGLSDGKLSAMAKVVSAAAVATSAERPPDSGLSRVGKVVSAAAVGAPVAGRADRGLSGTANVDSAAGSVAGLLPSSSALERTSWQEASGPSPATGSSLQTTNDRRERSSGESP